MKPVNWCKRHHACSEAVEWIAQYDTLADAWDNCQRREWMLWALDKIKYKDTPKLRLFEFSCVREIYYLLKEERGKQETTIPKELKNGWDGLSDIYWCPNKNDVISCIWDAIEKDNSVVKDKEKTTVIKANGIANSATVYIACIATDVAALSWSSAFVFAKEKQANILRETIGNPFKEE